MAKLQIDTEAVLKDLKPRKEGPNGNKWLTLDIKWVGQVPLEVIQIVLGAETKEELGPVFWLLDEDYNPRFGWLEVKALKREIHPCDVRISGANSLTLVGALVHKFQFTPRPLRLADLTWVVSVTDPPSNALPMLAEYIGGPAGPGGERPERTGSLRTDRGNSGGRLLMPAYPLHWLAPSAFIRNDRIQQSGDSDHG